MARAAHDTVAQCTDSLSTFEAASNVNVLTPWRATRRRRNAYLPPLFTYILSYLHLLKSIHLTPTTLNPVTCSDCAARA